MSHVVIIGAGQAGSEVAAHLRTQNYDGKITLIGAENLPPYQRPPLSKKYMLGDMALERLYLRPKSFYDDNNITLLLNTQVLEINQKSKCVSTHSEIISYDNLVLATGSWPRRLPDNIGGELEGVFAMRDIADADAMAPHFRPNTKALIIGGGYIGLEAAAVATMRGVDVTLIEMSERILQRVAAPQTSDYFRNLHQSHGVKVLENTGLDHLMGENNKLTGARLSDGSTHNFDFAIVGIGIAPASELTQNTTIEIDNGIKTNLYGQSSDPAIWAAGDCASFPSSFGQIRLESVQNAIDQAQAVAKNILGQKVEYNPNPWFWSDQYDTKLQIAGLNTGYDNVVERPNANGSSKSFWYYRADRLLAVDAINDGRAYMVGKRLIEANKSPKAEIISDPNIDLKSLLKA